MKFLIVLTFLYCSIYSQEQNKTTGLVLLDNNMSIQLDLDNQNSKVNLTLSGPSDRWFALGFNSTTMAANVDCVVMTSETSLSDSYFPVGYFAPLADAQNDWIIIENQVSNTIRTIKAVRNFSTSDVSDYTFTSTLNSLDVIWAYSYNPIFDLYDPVNSGHGADNYGHVTLMFSDLGTIQNNKISYVLKMFPNPINDELTLMPCNVNFPEIEISVYNSNYKLVYNKKFPNQNTNEIKIPFNNLPEGIYFLKPKIDSFESFKKLIVKNKN
jgi:hypothetical protein